MSESKKQSITIEIPCPLPRLLTPNRSRKAHWGTITRAKNYLQGTTLLCAYDARCRWLKENPKGKLPFEKGLLWYELVVKDPRSVMDDDNAISALKYCRDMLQEPGERRGAGIIANDRDWKTAQILWTISRERAPLIIIKVEVNESW